MLPRLDELAPKTGGGRRVLLDDGCRGLFARIEAHAPAVGWPATGIETPEFERRGEDPFERHGQEVRHVVSLRVSEEFAPEERADARGLIDDVGERSVELVHQPRAASLIVHPVCEDAQGFKGLSTRELA